MVGAGSWRSWRYWSLDPDREVRLGSDGEYEEGLQEVFTEAVRARVRSSGPVGSTLSGGLDSSWVTAVAGGLLAGGAGPGGPLRTYSVVFPEVSAVDPRIDERGYVGAVLGGAALTGASYEPHYVRGDGPGARPLRRRPLPPGRAVPRPHGVPREVVGPCGPRPRDASPLVWARRGLGGVVRVRAARGAGGGRPVGPVRGRGLGPGAGGPGRGRGGTRELFGLGALTAHARAGRLARFWREASEVSRRFGRPAREVAWAAGGRPLVPAWARSARGRLRRGRGGAPPWGPAPPWGGLHRAIDGDFARRVGLGRLGTTRRDVWDEGARRATSAGCRTACSSRRSAPTTESRPWSGVEQRYPFFDRRVIEYCVAVPYEQRLGDGWTRHLMRRAMGGAVPDAVRWRRGKGSLRTNARLRLVAERPLLDEAVLGAGADAVAPYVDVGRLRAAYGRFTADPAGASEEDLFTVFLSAALATWLRDAQWTPGNGA